MKHTQGEWKVSKESNFNQNVECNGVNVAQINRVNGTDGDEIELANAKLIAASPNLLKALIKAQKDLEQGIILPSTERLIKEAIEKATK